MEREKRKDIALGVFVLAIAIGGFLFVNPTDAPITVGPGGMSWRTMPIIYSALLLFLALLFIVTTALRKQSPAGSTDGGSGREEGADAPPAAGLRLSTVRRAAVLAVLVIYSQALGAFGFAISTPLFLFVLLHIFGRSNVRENATVALVGGLALWVLFAHLLHMPLRGDLWDPLSPALSALARGLGV